MVVTLRDKPPTLYAINQNNIKKHGKEMKETQIDKKAREYADKTLAMADPELAATDYARHTKMGVRVFDGNDLEVAFDCGYQQALLDIEKELDRTTVERFQFPVLHVRKWINQQRVEEEE